MSQTMKPAAAPAPNTLAQRPMAPAGGVGVPARPQQTAPLGSDRRTLTVGKGISVQGTVADCERLVVEGTVESQMLQAAELSVGSTGVFRGEVQVEDAEIAGLFDGTLTARGNLVIRSTGKVNGVARCKRLSVEDGGQLTGRMEMLTEGSMPPAPTAPAAPAPARPAPVV
jgi:cytoskeletal protein CcmA (bactofilin family)